MGVWWVRGSGLVGCSGPGMRAVSLVTDLGSVAALGAAEAAYRVGGGLLVGCCIGVGIVL